MKIIKAEEEYNFKVLLDRTNDQKYSVKIRGKSTSDDKELKDLTLEDFLELKELLAVFDFLNGDVHTRLADFLCLKNDITGWYSPFDFSYTEYMDWIYRVYGLFMLIKTPSKLEFYLRSYISQL